MKLLMEIGPLDLTIDHLIHKANLIQRANHLINVVSYLIRGANNLIMGLDRVGLQIKSSN